MYHEERSVQAFSTLVISQRDDAAIMELAMDSPNTRSRAKRGFEDEANGSGLSWRHDQRLRDTVFESVQNGESNALDGSHRQSTILLALGSLHVVIPNVDLAV